MLLRVAACNARFKTPDDSKASPFSRTEMLTPEEAAAKRRGVNEPRERNAGKSWRGLRARSGRGRTAGTQRTGCFSVSISKQPERKLNSKF